MPRSKVWYTKYVRLQCSQEHRESISTRNIKACTGHQRPVVGKSNEISNHTSKSEIILVQISNQINNILVKFKIQKF